MPSTQISGRPPAALNRAVVRLPSLSSCSSLNPRLTFAARCTAPASEGNGSVGRDGHPRRVEFALGDDHRGAGEPGAAALQGDGEPATRDGDLPSVPAVPVRGGTVRGGGRSGRGAGAAGAGLARAAVLHPPRPAAGPRHHDQPPRAPIPEPPPL